MLTTYIFFILGFGFLLKGADFLVNGASSLAKRLGISTLVIGLTVVACGTSAPELIVNIFSSIKGTTDIAIGNIIGSNIANILLILGIAGIIYPLKVTRGTVWKEIPLSLLAAVLVGVMASDAFIDKANFSALTRTDGLILLAFFIIFMYYIFGIAKPSDVTLDKTQKTLPTSTSLLFILLGLGGLIIGGKWIVDGAVAIAKNLKISESLIGLTIVAVGTSLPELATSAIAAYKKNTDIAIGNAVGSNIFNIFFVLGISAIINPLPFRSRSIYDVIMAVIASLLLFLFMFIGKRHLLERWQGCLFVVFYAVYIAFLIYLG